MTRRVTDGLIILAVLALGASHLWAQGMGGRQVVRPNQPGGGGAMHAAGGPNGGHARGGNGAGGGAGPMHAGGAPGGPGGPPSGPGGANPQLGPGSGMPGGACRNPASCR